MNDNNIEGKVVIIITGAVAADLPKAMTDWDRGSKPDLVAIKKSGTNSTEVHIMNFHRELQ
jgi:hypothetical protein